MRSTQNRNQPDQQILVVGAGPAGLTAASALAETGFSVVILEKDAEYVGGIARTVRYKGFRFDIGGHRFFSKSDEITAWWHARMGKDFIKVRRMSRIFYRGRFFDYPLKAWNALAGLGVWTSVLCVLSYILAKIFPTPENSFSDWVANRFGKRLFKIFFESYTEKVWGVPCSQISADWAAQRIRGLSLSRAVWHAICPPRNRAQKAPIKTLTEEFNYPRLGPGMMWEKTRDDIQELGGRIRMGTEITAFQWSGNRVESATTTDQWGETETMQAGQFIVSMPLRDCVMAFHPPLSESVRQAADKLKYRDFITVALMVGKKDIFPDNWIYVHDPSVKIGRIQNFNNWSSEMVPGEGVTCLGLEYFCFVGDELWRMPDEDLVALAKREIAKLGLAAEKDIDDGCVVRMEKAYPLYYPGYEEDVSIIRSALEAFENFQVIGRNGMHKYNNQDHSMMTALLAARRLTGEKRNPWNVNIDAEYHEEQSAINATSK
ncbi:MAG: NAD(P)/FAD-dependent oxidoreductase [Chthoniobacterales bacterium]|nr:NAD(P)/FAD-dependent oxidoreductase [Chthoniobacterales bacterium]